MRRKVSVRVSLRGMLRLNRGDTLRRVHNVGFLVIQLIYLVQPLQCIIWQSKYMQPFQRGDAL